MTVSLICLVVGGLIAVLGKVLQLMQQYEASLAAWGIVLYIAAGVMVLAGIINGITSAVKLYRRNQRRKDEEKGFQVFQFHNKRAINGTYVGGNHKKPGKSAAKPNTNKKYVN